MRLSIIIGEGLAPVEAVGGQGTIHPIHHRAGHVRTVRKGRWGRWGAARSDSRHRLEAQTQGKEKKHAKKKHPYEVLVGCRWAAGWAVGVPATTAHLAHPTYSLTNMCSTVHNPPTYNMVFIGLCYQNLIWENVQYYDTRLGTIDSAPTHATDDILRHVIPQ